MQNLKKIYVSAIYVFLTLIRNIYWNIVEKGKIAPQEQFLLFSIIFCNLILDFCV